MALTKRFLLLIMFLGLLFIIPNEIFSANTIIELIVDAGDYDRVNTPIAVDITEYLDDESFEIGFFETTGGKDEWVPSQIVQGERITLYWILDGRTTSGEQRSFELRDDIGQMKSENMIELSIDSTSLAILKKGKKSLKYNYGLIPPPDVNSDLFTRSGFIHPIWTPEGKVLTRIHASDHIHHMGFWNPWTKTVFEGRKVDFWNIGDGQGTVRFKKIIDLNSGPVFGGFEALQQHIDLTAPDGEKAALNELWEVKVWNITENPNAWVWDFTTTQWTASESPLEILKYRYGGFGFRGTADWNEQNSNYLTSEGKTREDGNGTRAKWCDVHGITDEGPGGVVFMNHPQNREFPEPMRIWPQGDVYFGYCPVVEDGFTMEPGKQYVRKYRVYAYDGDISAEYAESLWQDFGNPPNVTINRK